jgi:hypothetical protein
MLFVRQTVCCQPWENPCSTGTHPIHQDVGWETRLGRGPLEKSTGWLGWTTPAICSNSRTKRHSLVTDLLEITRFPSHSGWVSTSTVSPATCFLRYSYIYISASKGSIVENSPHDNNTIESGKGRNIFISLFFTFPRVNEVSKLGFSQLRSSR